MFQQVLLRLRQFLAGLVFAEAESPSADSGSLDGEEEIIIILAVEERHEVLQALKRIVDEKVFLIVAHGLPQIDVYHAPTALLKLRFDHPMEILGVDGVVRTECRSVVVKDHCFVPMLRVVMAEIGYQFRQLALELDIKRFDDIETATCNLARDYPVDIGIVVHADTDRSVRIDILVSSGGVDYDVLAGLNVLPYFIEILEVGSIVFMRFAHRRIETIFGYANLLAEDGCLKSERCQIALHLLDIVLTQQLQVLDG